jgi:hypothetical protein
VQGDRHVVGLDLGEGVTGLRHAVVDMACPDNEEFGTLGVGHDRLYGVGQDDAVRSSNSNWSISVADWVAMSTWLS